MIDPVAALAMAPHMIFNKADLLSVPAGLSHLQYADPLVCGM
jgi:hypothetical protein